MMTRCKNAVRSEAAWKAVILLIGAVALTWPFISNIVGYSGWHHSTIAESSIFSLDRARFFADAFKDKSLYLGGQQSVLPLTYVAWYALWSAVATMLPDAAAYLVLIIAFYLLAYYFLVELLLELADGFQPTIVQFAVACLLALLYLSSLSLFNYIKSNIFFALPYLILPALLFFALKYIRTGLAIYLLPYLIVALMISDFNLAHATILWVVVGIFSTLNCIGLSALQSVKRILPLMLLLLPGIIYSVGIAMANVTYRGSLASFAALAAEDMYSNNATALHILTQTTDWGLFGSWRGVPYYAFSEFYVQSWTAFFAIAPYLLIGYGFLTGKASRHRKRLAASITIVACVVFWLMLGDNNPVYHFLYAHVVFFRVFRNITKLAPLLYLLIVLATYLLIYESLRSRIHYATAFVLLMAALAYNVPFWSFQHYFFRDRFVQGVPQYWYEASAYLNSQLNPYSKILAVPAIFINDIYVWNGKLTWVQGSLLDVLARNHSYRLSECCMGSAALEMDARNVFVHNDRSIRGLDTDYDRLSSFAAKYHFDYVILTSDLVSEYQHNADIKSWLRRDHYERIAVFGPITVYRNPKNFRNPFSGSVLLSEKVTALNYRFRFPRIEDGQRFVFDVPFNAGWELRADRLDKFTCKEPHTIAGGRITRCQDSKIENPLNVLIAFFFGQRAAVLPHAMASGGSNEWFLNAAEIEKTFPTGSFRVNADGSIDLATRLYFRPEVYFLSAVAFAALSFCVSAIVIVGCIVLQSCLLKRKG